MSDDLEYGDHAVMNCGNVALGEKYFSDPGFSGWSWREKVDA